MAAGEEASQQASKGPVLGIRRPVAPPLSVRSLKLPVANLPPLRRVLRFLHRQLFYGERGSEGENTISVVFLVLRES